jgi:hypothetical protein
MPGKGYVTVIGGCLRAAEGITGIRIRVHVMKG